MGRPLLRRAAFVIVGALYGIALDFAAGAASGYDQDSSGLDIALGFAAGFPLSVLAFLSTVYFLFLAPPLMWMWIGWTLARRREGLGAEWAAPALLVMQGLGALLAPLAFLSSPLFHWSSKTWGALALFVVLWTMGFVEAWRLLARPTAAEGSGPEPPTRRAVVGRAAAAIALAVAAAAVLSARPAIEIACASSDRSCTVTRRLWWQRETRTWPVNQIHVRPGVPYSTLDVGSPGAERTILRVRCADYLAGGNFFNRCESRPGRLLADLEPFLEGRPPQRITLRDDQIEGTALIAAALMCGAAWLAADLFRRLRRAPGRI